MDSKKERMTLDQEVLRIIKKVGTPKAQRWIKERFGVVWFSKLDNKSMSEFINAHQEHLKDKENDAKTIPGKSG
jgi:predicted 3-demethylubiquinone-9 3-methyltransferase (glyoxalase superfamily)